MKLSTEIITNTPQELVYFDYLTMDIVPKGLLVKAKAPLFAEWIKTQSQKSDGGKLPTWTLAGSGKFYYPADQWTYTQPWGYAMYNHLKYFADEKPNLIWLFHTELATGCEMTFPEPISINNWEDYFTTSCRAVQDIYTRELRQASVSARFKEILE